MWLQAWRSFLGHKVRLALSTVAITFAVAFVSGSLIFTNLLNQAFVNIVSGALADVNVSSDAAADTRSILKPVNLAAIAGVPGVSSVSGIVSGFSAFVVREDGNAVGTPGAPSVSSNWVDAPGANGGPGLVLTSGRAPAFDDEIAIDQATLDKASVAVGDRVSVLVNGKKIKKKVVGSAQWGDAGGIFGAPYLFFTTHEAQRLFAQGLDVFHSAWVTIDRGERPDDVAARVAHVVPAGFQSQSAKQVADEAGESIASSLGFINTFLLVFAAIAVLVASFLIVNTFNMLVMQRSRELGLLRAIGAKRCQIVVQVLIEAGFVGAIASVLGLFGGWGLALAIAGVLEVNGFGLGTLTPTLSLASVVASVVVGCGVTLLASLRPAFEASRTSPIVAMTGDVTTTGRQVSRWSLALFALGLALLSLGLVFAGPRWVLIGAGALTSLFAAAWSSPIVARPVVSVMTRLFVALAGDVGEIAGRNVTRQPRRLAATTAALMIGLCLVTTISVLGSSAAATTEHAVRDGIRGDLQLSTVTGQPFALKAAQEAGDVPGVKAVYELHVSALEVTDAKVSTIAALTEDAFDKVVSQTLTSGRFPSRPNEAIISAYRVKKSNWGIGDTIEVIAQDQTRRSLTIVGTFENPPAVQSGTVLVNTETLASIAPVYSSLIATIILDDPTSAGETKTAIEKAITDKTVIVTDNAEYTKAKVAQLSIVLNILYALLGLALVIAVLGIVNTLALGVIERTREIGLLRAIGTTRRQIRRIIELESIIISVVGSGLGIALGLTFGLVIRQAAASDGLSVLSINVGQIAMFLVLAAAVGMVAGLWPARRAARLDVLAAISTS